MIRSKKINIFLTRKSFLWGLTVASAAILGISFRLYPLVVYPEYSSKNRAEILVYSNIQKSVERSIQKKYAGMPLERQIQITNASLKKFLDSEKTKTREMIKKVAQKIRSDEKLLKSSAYLMEVDPYYYLRLTQNLDRNNSPPPPKRGREYLDKTMLAPDGAWYPTDYHPHTGLAIYRFLKFFLKDIPLQTALGFTPIFLAVLCLIPFFCICSGVFNLSPGSSFLGATYLLLAPAFLRRSLWGWYDTDPYNVLFPLLVIFCLLLFFKETESAKRKCALLALAGVASAVYSLFWRGWLLSHALICGAFLLTLIFLQERSIGQKATEIGRVAAFYIPIPFILTCVFWGPEGLWGIFREAAAKVREFYLPAFELWPDAFMAVGELRRSSPASTTQSLGGMPILALLLIGTIPVLAKKQKSNSWIKPCVGLLATLLVLTVLLGSGIERFLLLAVGPAAIAAALGAERIRSWLHKKSPVALILRTAILGTLLGYVSWQAHLAARFEHPIYNSSWDRVMTFLRKNTPEESIITSWWCPGHYISSMADRRVTFDGATQNTPQIYWVANLFLDSSEDKAAAILRMLNLGGNRAVAFLSSKNIKLSDAVGLIHEILPMDKAKAFDRLNQRLDPEDSRQLLDLTHGSQPPPSYLLIYNDMVDQVMALEYTGKWDFAKAERFQERLQQNPSGAKHLLDRSSKEHVILTWSMAEGPYAQDKEAYQNRRTGSTVYFTNGLALNLDTMDAQLSSKKFGSGKPKSLYFMSEENPKKLQKKTYGDSDLSISVLLIKDKVEAGEAVRTTYRTVLAEEKLLESLIFRLYYLKGDGLTRFRLVADEENAANRTKLYVFEVIQNVQSTG